MDVKPYLFFGKVMHHRLTPRVNKFVYRIYYCLLPLKYISALKNNFLFAVNRPALLSFYNIDHGSRNQQDLSTWSHEILKCYGLNESYDIVLLTLPRVMQYVFNPVSFWLAFNSDRQLCAVLAEVNNTFGETHTYICRHSDNRIIKSQDILKAEKVFHVSPFLDRTGYYTFRFNVKSLKIGIWIDYWTDDGKKQLLTSLTGQLVTFNQRNLIVAFLTYPCVTLKTVCLIHWQALKLLAKKIRYRPKPSPLPIQITSTQDITNI